MTFVRAENRTVAALVTDGVNVDDLLLPVDFQILIAAVRAGFHAHAAESAALQTAGSIAVLEVRVQGSPFAQTGIFKVQWRIFPVIRFTKVIHGFCSGGDRQHNSLRSAQAVSDDLDIILFDRQAFLIKFDTETRVKIAIHLFTERCNNSITENFTFFTGRYRFPPSGGICITQLHHFTYQLTVFQRHRSQQRLEEHTVFHRFLQLAQVRRHVGNIAAVNDGNILHPIDPFRCPCRIHGSVSGADNNNMFSEIQLFPGFQFTQEFDRVQAVPVFQLQFCALVGADG